ncbi:MAG: hypothetical protein PGN26_01665 [Xylophilus ampelinus]
MPFRSSPRALRSPSASLASLLLLSLGLPAAAATLSVGPGKAYATPCQALTRAAAGDVVEIDAAGTYSGDVCAFYANDLTIRGVNGRPKIDAAGKNANGKGIWVVGGTRTTIDNVEMYGAKVPDQNGAALRLDGKHLTLRNSHLHHNENGILTNNDGVSDIVVEDTEFGFNGYGDGYSHNLYVGKVNSLVFRYNFSHDANVGHNLKSRANTNTIAYNRFSSSTGKPSYEIDLPNAGTSVILGNVIHQPADNNNPGLVAYGMEGASNAGKDLYVVNNTFINDRSSGGTFLLVGSGVTTPVLAQNNLFVGTGTFSTQGATVDRSNLKVASYAFVDRAGFDLRPASGSPAVDAGTDAGATAAGASLAATQEYLPTALFRSRAVSGRIDIGAYESGSAALTSGGGSSGNNGNGNGGSNGNGNGSGSGNSVSDGSWTPCAAENGTCAVSGMRTVRYGANGKYVYKTAMGNVACNNATFGDPAMGVVKSCAVDASAAAVQTWSYCAGENGSCAVSGTRQVRYGAGGRYAYKTVTGGVSCSNAVFGDPAVGVVKACEASS